MRLKIGLCCTDDLISIFRDLGMEMTLFKCFVLAPGLLYLCLIPVHRRNLTLHRESALAGMDPPNYNHSLQTQQGVHPTTTRQHAWREREHLTRSRSHLHPFCSATLMHAFKKIKQRQIPKGLCLQR